MTTANINRQLSMDKSYYKSLIKVLLLGSGESGKSTFVKQMRIINGKHFSEDELKLYKLTVYNNLVLGMKVLIDATIKLGVGFSSEESSNNASFVFSFDSNIKLEEPVFQQYSPAIQQLWSDPGVQAAYARRREFLLGDSTKYFMDNLERISRLNYRPTNQDILYSRKATKGVSEYDFEINKVPFRFVDVGGQRSQRQKWFQCFLDVKSILFLVSSSEFDQVIYEDRRTNRLVESCAIFEAVANNRAFQNVSIILFLNKTDLLEQKIATTDISAFFPSFKGDSTNLQDVQAFLLSQFEMLRKDKKRHLFPHFTTAVDTENIKHVFADVKQSILSSNINDILLQ